MKSGRVLAVDLGASSGRVYSATVTSESIDLDEVSRFPNGPLRRDRELHWDFDRLWREIKASIAVAATESLDSIGIDSWAVDYGLVRNDGDLIAAPFHYRDERTIPIREALIREEGAQKLYERSGIALLTINTLYQLLADRNSGILDHASRALMIPDLISQMLTGEEGSEVTNASTTQMLRVDGTWDVELMKRQGLSPGLFAPLRTPGDESGFIRPKILKELGLSGRYRVTAVASHDTASAVAAVPARSSDFAYISCGTWSLVGVELDHVVTSPDALAAGFSNERGLGGRVRFLRNVMGFWLLQESVKTWERAGERINLDELMASAAMALPLRSIFDPDELQFLPPGDMPARIAAACRRRGEPESLDHGTLARSILESLALAYRRTLEAAQDITGRSVRVVHIVGGGCHNRLLCQMTADACGVVVVAGPAEASAVGNALVQAQALGVIDEGPEAIRRFVTQHFPLDLYEPNTSASNNYEAAARRMIA
jgi:rhamnulokinase